MENQTINLTMNGRTIGIGIYSILENCQLTTKNGAPLLFKNISQAKIYAENAKGLTNPLDYDFSIVINGSVIDYNAVDFVDGAYQLYASDGNIYNIKPIEKFAVEKIGYIVFNGNKRIASPDEGKKANLAIIEAVKDAANNIARFPNRPNTFESIKRMYDCMTLKIKKTSGAINILCNSQIMNINQNRKNYNLRVFHFDREMDKFNTLYFFIQREYYEPEYFGTIDKCTAAMDNLINEIKKTRPDVELKYMDLQHMAQKMPIKITRKLNIVFIFQFQMNGMISI
jgi:hypothetical protein